MNGDQNPDKPGQDSGQQNQPRNTTPPPPAGGPPAYGQSQENQSGSQKFGAKPPPEVNIRSMESDKKSIEGGESTPVPESVVPPQDKKEPEFRPETQASDAFKGIGEDEKPPSKKGFIWTVVIILIVVILAIIYFFVLPSGTGSEAQIPPPPSTKPSPPALITHKSIFNPKPSTTSEIRLNSLLVTSITSALQALAANKLPANTVQEVSVFDDKGSQIPFGAFAAAYINGLTTAQISNWFEDDFTAFLFYDQNGVWPGYVAKIKNGVNLDAIKANLKAIETSDIGKFYLAPAGNFGQFKNGALNNNLSRYNIASQPGASFNYLFTDNLFIISTSFTGLNAIAPMLGL